MIVAEEKKKENIAEYILFIWQMQDLVRAANFKKEMVEGFVQSYAESDENYKKEKRWFMELMADMKDEGIEKKGNLSEITELISEIFYLHNTLLNVIKDKKYTELFEEAQPNMAAYLQKAGGSTSNDVETCLTALYGLLVLRLKKADISEETEKAMETFSRLMAYLSQKYKAMKKGEMNFNLN